MLVLTLVTVSLIYSIAVSLEFQWIPSQSLKNKYTGEDYSASCGLDVNETITISKVAFYLSANITTDFSSTHTSMIGSCSFTADLWVPDQISKSSEVGKIQCPNGETDGLISYINITLNLSLVSRHLLCEYSMLERNQSYTDSLLFDFIRTPPSSLRMDLFPTERHVIEGQPLIIQCIATTAEPESRYTYAVTIEGVPHSFTIASNSTESVVYTPIAAARAGFTVSCTDTEHRDWPKQDDISATSQIIYPFYYEADTTLYLSTGTSQELDCDITRQFIDNVDLSYSWAINGSNPVIDTGSSINVTDTGKHGITEIMEIKCDVTLSEAEGEWCCITKTWRIYWEQRSNENTGHTHESTGLGAFLEGIPIQYWIISGVAVSVVFATIHFSRLLRERGKGCFGPVKHSTTKLKTDVLEITDNAYNEITDNQQDSIEDRAEKVRASQPQLYFDEIVEPKIRDPENESSAIQTAQEELHVSLTKPSSKQSALAKAERKTSSVNSNGTASSALKKAKHKKSTRRKK